MAVEVLLLHPHRNHPLQYQQSRVAAVDQKRRLQVLHTRPRGEELHLYLDSIPPRFVLDHQFPLECQPLSLLVNASRLHTRRGSIHTPCILANMSFWRTS